MLFPNVDVEKLKIELPLGSGEGSLDFSGKDPEEDEDLASLL